MGARRGPGPAPLGGPRASQWAQAMPTLSLCLVARSSLRAAEAGRRVHANCHLIRSYQWSSRSWRMAPGARGANKPIPGGKTVRSGPNQTFPGRSAAPDPGKRRGKGKSNRGGGGGGRPGLAGEPLSAAGAGARRARRLDGGWGGGGVGEVPGKVSVGRRGAASAGVRQGPSAPTLAALCAPARPPSASASSSTSARPAGSPAGLRERPARAGRGPGRRVARDPRGGGGAGVAEGLWERERGPGAVPPARLKVSLPESPGRLSVRQVTVRGQRGPAGRAGTPGWEGLGRPRAGSGEVHAGSGAGGSSPAGAGPAPVAGGVAERRETFLGSFDMVRSPLSRLSQEGGRRCGCEGDTQSRDGRSKAWQLSRSTLERVREGTEWDRHTHRERERPPRYYPQTKSWE